MKIYKTIITSLSLLFCLQGIANADSEAAPYPWVTTSKNEKILFKMVPQKFHWENDDRSLVVDREAFGIAYKIDDSGGFEELWRVEGWYAFGGEISDDGKYFVRYGPWASDQKGFTDLAIAFYESGELLKEYQVQELIKNTNSLEHSVSHYQWKARSQSKPNGFEYRSYFHLVMIDKTAYRFNYETGEIVDVGIDVNAKSPTEASHEKLARKNISGIGILSESDFQDAYEEHFTLYFIEAHEGEMSDVHYKDPVWETHLRPKKKYSHVCIGSMTLPIHDGGVVRTSITPSEIDNAFETALSHPYILHRFEGETSQAQLVLYLQEDLLHKNTKHLKNQYKKVKRAELAEEKLRDWTEFWITPNSPECTSFFLNTKTKEIIYFDRPSWSAPSVLSLAGPDWKEQTREPEH
ncbi:hypothetical protein [Pontiella sulfatireligans]|uniref:Uncharacterized protein n=1 Tax=Pontiella sulfatireligans TaxID=2750658 RepID=A0A6C2USQ4_9BACT|nr:hypothetical protein [Pontiella sulfatireligans]VGO22983.1 hypothetical protein SCARR_05082 [Pontiella sulfatireligans]